jgi:hypothetical protein
MNVGQNLGRGLRVSFLGVVNTSIEFEVTTWVESVVGKEGRRSSGLRHLVVGSKFGHRKVAVPVVLEVVDIGTEVLFHHCIESFGLSIGLRVKGGAEANVNFQADAEVAPEAGNELWSSIGDDSFREAVEAPDFSEEQVGKVFSVDRGVARNQVALLGQAADDGGDRVETVGRW